jgi:RNA polymerase sigma-70 factor (ECF subfamily)
LRLLNYRYGNALAAVAERILNDKADAEEIAADVLWQVWRQAVVFDPARGSVGAWLMTLVRSRAIDRLRARNARLRPAGVAEDPAEDVARADDETVAIDARQRRAIVKRALDKLDGRERTVLELAYYSDLSQSAIAERTGLPLGTVKSRIRAALLKLREDLKGFVN